MPTTPDGVRIGHPARTIFPARGWSLAPGRRERLGVPRRLVERAEREAEESVAGRRATLGVVLVVAVLSIFPVTNLLSSHQAMNRGYNPLDFVNTYGAFGSVGSERREIVFEGGRSGCAEADFQGRRRARGVLEEPGMAGGVATGSDGYQSAATRSYDATRSLTTGMRPAIMISSARVRVTSCSIPARTLSGAPAISPSEKRSTTACSCGLKR